MRKQVLSLLVENNPGVTSRISGLFSRRGYNIDSFSSGVTADPRYTRITIVATGDEQILEQIEKQVAKLEDVLDIKKLEDHNSICSVSSRFWISMNSSVLSVRNPQYSSQISSLEYSCSFSWNLTVPPPFHTGNPMSGMPAGYFFS